MAMQEYKIVNATQLDSDLAELASKYRDTFGISATTPLIFPESFIETVDGIEKRDSLLLTEKTITALAGYYKFDTHLTLPADYVNTADIKKNSNDMIFEANSGTITAPAGYYEADATYTLLNVKESKDMTFDESAKIVTTPAGYYKVDAVFQLPESYINITPVTKGAEDVTLEGKAVTVSAGYYAENIVHNLPESYIDTTDKIVTEIPDAATIAAALPAGTQITIPAGYYPDGIVIASSQIQETPAE